MYQKYQRPLAIFGAVSIVFLGFGFARYAADDISLVAASKEGRQLIPGMSVEVDRLWKSGEVVFETMKTENLGQVVWALSNVSDSISPCYLGAFYFVKKDAIPHLESKKINASEVLSQALDESGYLKPKAKEFNDSFLIFEPNLKSCPGGIFMQKKELLLRQAVWKSVETAAITSR